MWSSQESSIEPFWKRKVEIFASFVQGDALLSSRNKKFYEIILLDKEFHKWICVWASVSSDSKKNSNSKTCNDHT